MVAQHGDHHIIVRTAGGQYLTLEDRADGSVMFEMQSPDDPEVRETFILQSTEAIEVGGWLYGLVLAYAAKIDSRHPSQYRGN